MQVPFVAWLFGVTRRIYCEIQWRRSDSVSGWVRHSQEYDAWLESGKGLTKRPSSNG